MQSMGGLLDKCISKDSLPTIKFNISCCYSHIDNVVDGKSEINESDDDDINNEEINDNDT
jgi:hypothetical protein